MTGINQHTCSGIYSSYENNFIENRSFKEDFSRWLAGLVPALMVTVLLLVIMQSLISTNYVALEEVDSPFFEPPVFVEKPIEIRQDTKPKVPEKPSDPPAIPSSQIDDIGEKDISVPKLSLNNKKPALDGISGMSSLPVAAYLVSAKYPSSAIRRNLEGYVDIAFDVDEAGITRNIRVTAAEPLGVFEQAALEAVSRWRFKPKMVDGKAEYFAGLSKRIRFEMEK